MARTSSACAAQCAPGRTPAGLAPAVGVPEDAWPVVGEPVVFCSLSAITKREDSEIC